jgi:hypothetical protein
MRRRTLFAPLILAALVAVGIVASPAGAAGTATLDPVSVPVKPGDVVPVTGVGWPAGQMVSVSVCGNNGVNGSANCALSEASTFPITRDGTLSGRVYVTTPPAPCPCVLKVVSMGSTAQKQTPMQIEGAPWSDEVAATTVPSNADEVPVTTYTPPDPTLRIDSVTIDDTSDRGTLFGASATRLLRLTVTNTGELPVKDAHMSLRYGKGDDPQMVVETPDIPVIAAGESITVDVPFELGALSYGDFTIAGDIGVVGNRVPFEGETSTWPWGLLIVAFVLVQLLVLWVLRRNRRKRLEREAELAAGPLPTDAAPDGAANDLPAPEEPQLVAVGNASASIGDPAGDGATATDSTIPPRDIGLDGPVTAAPWH